MGIKIKCAIFQKEEEHEEAQDNCYSDYSLADYNSACTKCKSHRSKVPFLEFFRIGICYVSHFLCHRRYIGNRRDILEKDINARPRLGDF
jgi:hypothetical protein